MGYTPKVEWVEGPNHLPAVAMQISELDKIRNNALEQIARAQNVMIRIGLTIVCLLRTYVSPLSLSAVSSHVVVLLLILGSV
jgi:hypothetical protein